MIVRSAKRKDGTFGYEVWNGRVMIEAGNGYPSAEMAQNAANACHRELHSVNFIWPHKFMQNDYMSIDDIMAELDA